MKHLYVSPSLEMILFKTEDVLEASDLGGVIITPPENGGEVEIGGSISLY